MQPQKGTYCLLLSLREEKKLTIGKLGRFSFPPGYYVYTGRAMRGLLPRIRRHLQRKKRLRWHIDYFTQAAKIEVVLVCETRDRIECEVNQTIRSWKGAQVIVRGFGSSDCLQGCESHLIYFNLRPPIENLLTLEGQRWGLYQDISSFMKAVNLRKE